MTALTCNSASVVMCIYTITHHDTGRVYVGQTRGRAGRRWQSHCAPSNKSRRGIVGALLKYGKERFDFDVIDIAETQDQLDHKERFWIKQLNTIAPHGFNLERGGNSNKSVSDATRNVQREARAAWLKTNPDTRSLGNGSRGRKRRPEEVEAIKRGLTGRPVSKETKERMSAKQRGVPKPLSRVIEMARSRMKERIVVCEDGHVYLSFSEAASNSGLDKVSIFNAATGKTKTCGGLRWWLDVREA